MSAALDLRCFEPHELEPASNPKPRRQRQRKPVSTRACPEGASRGIDVARMEPEIAKLVVAWSSRFAKDIDREDLVQEVIFAILRRNSTARSAFDPTLGSFGRYVTMVARNVAGHMRAKPFRQCETSVAGFNLERLSKSRLNDPYAAERSTVSILDRLRMLAILDGGAS